MHSCLYSLHNATARFKPLGVSVKHSKQSIVHLPFGYSFLNQAGKVSVTCCLLGQMIKTDSSLDNNLIHVIFTLLTVVKETINLNGRCLLIRPNFNFINVKTNSCSDSSFRHGPGRHFGKTLPGSP